MESKTGKHSSARGALITAATTLLLMFAVTGIAQQNMGTILGVVKDASGAVIPGVSVTIINEETNLTRTVITGENGAFRAPALPVGRYTVRVELTGFQTQTQRGLILEVAQELVVNPILEVGAGPRQLALVEAVMVRRTGKGYVLRQCRERASHGGSATERAELRGPDDAAARGGPASDEPGRSFFLWNIFQCQWRSGAVEQFHPRRSDNREWRGRLGCLAIGYDVGSRWHSRVQSRHQRFQCRVWFGDGQPDGHGKQEWNEPMARRPVRVSAQ